MIGVDIEKIDRFAHWTDEEFMRVFSKAEIEYANRFTNKIEHFCGFFCVKEAFVKALDDDGVSYNQIEVLHTDTGKPYINRTRYINEILHEYFANKIEVSISHCKEYAVAVVSIE